MAGPNAVGTFGGSTGPASGAIPAPISAQNIKRIELNFQSDVGRVEWVTAQGENKFFEWDLAFTSTLTDTITGVSPNMLHTFVISG